MEKYTFEQLTNERIREYNELDKKARKLENLIEVVDDEYKMGFIRHDGFHDREMWIYYSYSNESKNLLHKLKISARDGNFKGMAYICPANVIAIKSDEDIKSEYVDSKGNTALIIKDVDKFKEKYNALYDSEEYKHLRGMKNTWCENDKILAMNKIRLEINGSFLTFIHEDRDVSFELVANQFVVLAGTKGTASNNVDTFRYAEFSTYWFDDYVRSNIEEHKNDNMYFVFDTDYKQRAYHPVSFGRFAMEEQFKITQNELESKLVLKKVPRG